MPFAEPTPIPGQGGFQANQPWWNYSVPIGSLQGGGWQGSNLMSPYDPSYPYGAYGSSPVSYQGYTPYTDFSDAWTGSNDPWAGYTVGAEGYVDPFAGFTANSESVSPSVMMPQDTSQSPAGVFAGLQEPVPSFSEPGALGYDVPTPEGWVDGLPPLIDPPPIPDVPADSSPVDPFGTQLPTANSWPAPDALPPGMNYGNATGVFAVGGPFSTSGPGSAGPQFHPGIGLSFSPGSSVSIPGIPGHFLTTPSGQTYSTAIGMFGLGAMNAAGSNVSMTGAGYGDQASRASSGWDQGLGDPGAVGDFIDFKSMRKAAKGK